MKLNELAWANASAIVTGLIYVVCAAAVAFLPDFSKALAESWFHGLDLNQIWTGTPRSNFVLGLVSAMIGTWLVGYVFAGVYNKLKPDA
ncbi:hypothetical protein HY404_03205 [Candidatus Microgenomates bacterium]|nr:hypothetical protein [Candidatus Microgenomates bacterium]